MTEHELCRTCRQPLPDDAPWGLCPACLFSQAIGDHASGRLPADEPSSGQADREEVSRALSIKVEEKAEAAGFPEVSGRYRLEREIGRGGMGRVILGFDAEIGREIALKVLLEKYRGSAQMTRRFVEEARIGGQLVHPAIVPVYEMGTCTDGRPFFVMKLVQGRTLSDLLASRISPADDLPRYLSIFDQVSQSMAYAHSRRIIHRDLKSTNIMVGAFGEVQTMDWGMARQFPREDQSAADIPSREERDELLSTVDGSIKGTPNYMSPEQARGEGARLDERTDVFALGAILCEILTGRPPYLGESPEEVLASAARADLADALAELDDCGADVELQGLARRCLAPSQDERPRSAGEVAAAMAVYFKGVQDRLRQAELDRARAETRAQEEIKQRALAEELTGEALGRATSERKRRRLQAFLAASVIALTTMGGLGAVVLREKESARAASIARVIGVASTMRDVAGTAPEEIARWRTALAAVEQAEALAGGDSMAVRQVQNLRDEVRAGLDSAERDRALLDRIVEIRSSRSDDPEGIATDAAYALAFREAGIDLANLPPADAGARIKARPPSVAVPIAAALDDWSAVRAGPRNDRANAWRLIEAARAADPDDWRNKLRETLLLVDKRRREEAMTALVETAKFNELGPTSLVLLAQNTGNPALAEKVLHQAERSYPDDVWVNYELARVLEKRQRRDAAVRFYTAARALQPETAHDLAHVLTAMGESDEAIEVFQGLAQLRPENSRHLSCLGYALVERGRSKEATLVLEKATAVCREKVRLRPDSYLLHFNLACALQAQGRLDEAAAAYREAIRLKPDDVVSRSNLGNVLRAQRKANEATVEFREAIRLRPDYADAHSNLGAALYNLGRLDEAVAAYREAIRFKPDSAIIRYNLGTALKAQRHLEQANAEFREAIRLKPDFYAAHGNLGETLAEQGKIDEAIDEYRKAILINPEGADAYLNLAELLRGRGDFAGSLAMFRKAHESGTKRPGWRHRSAQLVAEAERLVALADRLPALLNGKDHPKDPAECLALAQICRDRKLNATATRYLLEALESQPELAADRQAQRRYDGACAAALAASGETQDDPRPDEAAKAKLRGQALRWLKAELEAWTKELSSGPQSAWQVVAQTLADWQQESDLAAIRDPQALAKLPEVERKEWQALWVEVDRLLKQAQEKRPASRS